MKYRIEGNASVQVFRTVEANSEDEAWEIAEDLKVEDLEEMDFDWPAYCWQVENVRECAR